MGRLLRFLIILGVLAAVVIGAMQRINSRQAASEPPAPVRRPAPLVRTLVVDATRLVEQSTFPADVRASATVDIVSRMAGRLGAVLVEEGSQVAAGSLVARIDDPELELAVRQAEAAVEVQRARLAQLRAGPRPQEVAQAEAAVDQAETSLAQAERDLARARQLFAEGLVARAAVDRAETDTELARARLRAAREHLALVRQGPRPEDIEAQAALVRQAEAQAAAARARLRELRITSPIAGVVTRVDAKPGAVISTQTVVATVATIRPIEVHVMLPETDLPRLRRTTVVRIRVDALPDRLFEGRIARVASALDAASRSVRLVVVLPNGDQALRPGMFARATVVFDERQAILIPSDAIVRRGEATLVFVVKDDTVEERGVRVGYVEGSRSEIIEGLDPGEPIVVAGQQGLRDGMKVRTGAGGEPPSGPAGNRPQPSPGPGRTRP
ncbi:MAG: efflux RND transporter periplasmic adaptor subunit [Armatimonadota bacterium]|nr:efflux RND transporter periplasmic adaptor subunit [Armatimonadota bacterium]MDR7549673.1 efflux RND transporter periplasmic adaptor subunit [Armatimonadota bacterium]